MLPGELIRIFRRHSHMRLPQMESIRGAKTFSISDRRCMICRNVSTWRKKWHGRPAGETTYKKRISRQASAACNRVSSRSSFDSLSLWERVGVRA
jgi:hypothetical protein